MAFSYYCLKAVDVFQVALNPRRRSLDPFYLSSEFRSQRSFAVMVFLVALNPRRKSPFIPLLPVF